MDSNFLAARVLAAPQDVQEQVVRLVCPSRSVPRTLISVQRGDAALIRVALDRQDPPVIQQVENLLGSPPEPAA
jgi:hypothetical protein